MSLFDRWTEEGWHAAIASRNRSVHSSCRVNESAKRFGFLWQPQRRHGFEVRREIGAGDSAEGFYYSILFGPECHGEIPVVESGV